MKPSSQPPRTPSRLSESVHHRLNLYAPAQVPRGFDLTQPLIEVFGLCRRCSKTT